MFPWTKELWAYDDEDKLCKLAAAMELDVSRHQYIKSFILDYQREKSLDMFTDSELTAFVVDAMQMQIWQEMEVRREKRKLEKLIHGECKCRHWFVTVGFDDKLFKEGCNEAGIINPLVKRICDTKGFDDVKFVVEKFRKDNGGNIYIHRHVHLLVTTDMRKSKIIENIYNKVKRWVAGKNFVDCKSDQNRDRDKYIRGEKIDEKMECVKKDIEWRKNVGIVVMD